MVVGCNGLAGDETLSNPRNESTGSGSEIYGGGGSSSGDASWGEVPVAPNEGDQYEAVGTNPFVLASADPLSTFGADVDTASYDVFRRDVNNGYLPQPDSVRLEEYVNYFHYAYPAPAVDAEHPFQISLAAAPHLSAYGTKLFRVGIQAREAVPGEERDANLVYLVDTSGSMASSDKLALAQFTLKESLKVLQPTDTVSIVTYAGDVSVRLTPTPVSSSATIIQAIDGLDSGGGTNGAGGIQLAYQQAQAGFIEGGLNHVVLCTDGDFNIGVSGTDELVTMIEEKRKTGITLTVLGYGVGNLNDSMMEQISNKGNGVYGVISDEDQATKYVHERLLSTMNFVAKDMKIQVEFNKDRVYAYRLLGYENRAIADDDFRNDVIDAGEVGEGHRVTALYELVLTGQSVPAPQGAPAMLQAKVELKDDVDVAAGDIAIVKVRYKDVDATETDPAYEISASLAASALAQLFAQSNEDLQYAAAVAALAEILKESPFADPSKLADIQTVVGAQAAQDGDRQEFDTLLTSAVQLVLNP